MEAKKEGIPAWVKTTAKGDVINFSINGVKYNMWKNQFKNAENQPDFKIYINDWVATPVDQKDVTKW
jgi:hypothetical protein